MSLSAEISTTTEAELARRLLMTETQAGAALSQGLQDLLAPAPLAIAPSPAPQRKKMIGVRVGTWKSCGFAANQVALGLTNTVHLSRDTAGRMHRRVTKVGIYGVTVQNSPFDSSRPSCKYEDIHYIARLRAKSQAEVDARMLPELMELNGAEVLKLRGADQLRTHGAQHSSIRGQVHILPDVLMRLIHHTM